MSYPIIMSSETPEGLCVVFNYMETSLINHLFSSQMMDETCFHIKIFYAFSYYLASKSHITKVHMVEKSTNYIVTSILHQKSLISQGKDNFDSQTSCFFFKVCI